PFHELVTRILEWALLPFASGLAVSVFLVGEQSMSGVAGIVAGTAIFAAALFIWYIFSVLKTTRRPSPIPQQEPTKLREKIKQGLIEARMILPGAQALLGFQVANAFTSGFQELDRASKWTHMGSLVCVALSTI